MKNDLSYRPDIDGLRAVAVLSVVLCHAGIAAQGGYVGVDVFFVISGYLIASLMLRDLKAGTFSLAHFWERRIRRIMPALFVVVAASFLVGWFLLVPKAYQMFGRSVVSLMLLRSNAFFARHTDYFASGDEAKPLLHTWSLSVEEQFYLLVPLLFWGAMRLRRQAWLGPIVGALALISFGCSVYGTSIGSRPAYFALSTRAWEIFAGVLTAIFLPSVPRMATRAREFAAALGLLGVALPCFLYDASTPFPGVAALPPVLGTVLLIVFGARAEQPTWVYRVLASRPAVSMGLISYSLYLWHWPLIVFLKSHGEWLSTAWGRGFVIAASTGLAFITYRYVERPFRRGDYLATRPRLIVATASVFVCLVTAGQVLRYSNGMVERLPPRAQLLARTGAENDSYCCLHQAEDVPHNLLRVGAAGVEPRLLVWGDSHAGVLMPVIDEMCQNSGAAARLAMFASRPPVIHHCTQASPRDRAAANAFGTAVIQYAKSSSIDTVLLAGVWSSYFTLPGFAESLLETVDELRTAGKRVYFLKDVPKFDFDVAASLIHCEWHGNDVGKLSVSLQEYEAANRHETMLPLLLARGVNILDPIPYLQAESSSDTIPACNSQGSFYFDANHISLHGARVIQPVFMPVVDEIVRLAQSRERTNPSRQVLTGEAPQRSSLVR